MYDLSVRRKVSPLRAVHPSLRGQPVWQPWETEINIGEMLHKVKNFWGEDLNRQHFGKITLPTREGDYARITLGKNANKSTFVHELAHFYLYILRDTSQSFYQHLICYNTAIKGGGAMGIVKEYNDLFESVKPDVPIEDTTSASEIISIGWAFLYLFLFPISAYIAWWFFSSPLLLGGILDFMLPQLWLIMTFGVICGIVFALRVLYVREAQKEAYYTGLQIEDRHLTRREAVKYKTGNE